ncbi:hypothetical protein ACLOJK_023898 [Asimina triloba]
MRLRALYKGSLPNSFRIFVSTAGEKPAKPKHPSSDVSRFLIPYRLVKVKGLPNRSNLSSASSFIHPSVHPSIDRQLSSSFEDGPFFLEQNIFSSGECEWFMADLKRSSAYPNESLHPMVLPASHGSSFIPWFFQGAYPWAVWKGYCNVFLGMGGNAVKKSEK